MSISAEQLVPLSGYENIFGTKKAFVGELVGPASYVTGGQEVTSSQLGWGGFDLVDCPCLSLSGTYEGKIQLLPVDGAPSAFSGSVQSVNVLWFVVATGAEVDGDVDLSGEIMRIFALGV
ncbi:MAG: hypothetical protein ACREJN_21290 [Nitrospiraceae bacterium]